MNSLRLKGIFLKRIEPSLHLGSLRISGAEQSKLVAGGEWDAKNKLIPRLVRLRMEKLAGSQVPGGGVLPAKGMKQAGCGGADDR